MEPLGQTKSQGGHGGSRRRLAAVIIAFLSISPMNRLTNLIVDQGQSHRGIRFASATRCCALSARRRRGHVGIHNASVQLLRLLSKLLLVVILLI